MQHVTSLPDPQSSNGTRIAYYVLRITFYATRITQRMLAGPLPWWVLLWAAWAVRLWQLDASDLTYDETTTYYVANRPLLDILTYLRGAVREHPPVYYLLIRLWMNLAGTSEYSLRFFAAGASMLGIALTARLARALARRLDAVHGIELTLYALLSALVLALFPLEVYYARDARMYTLVSVWAVLSSLRFLPLLLDRDGPRPSALVGLLLVNGLALFTHYYLALLILTQFMSLLLLRRWRAWLAWSASHGLVGLAGVVWVVRSPGLSASLTEAWGRFTPAWPTVNQLRRLLADLLFSVVEGVPWTLVYGWGLLIALGLLVAWRRSRLIGAWLTLTALAPVALAFLMPEPPRPRYLAFVLPFAALAFGQLLFVMDGKRLWKSGLTWLGLSALSVLVLGGYGLPRTVRWIKSSYGHTLATVSAYARPGDGVLFHGPWQGLMFQYYQPQDFPPITALPPYAPPRLVPEEAEPELQKLLANYQRLWVLPAAVEDVDPARFVTGWLNTHAHPVWVRPDFSLYLPPFEHAVLSLPLGLTFGDRLRLERVSGDGWQVPAGEALRLALTWTVSELMGGDVVLKLELVDQGGQIWRQRMATPGEWLHPPSAWQAGETVTDRQGLIVPQGAPPGVFTLRLTVIDATTGVPLPVADAGGLRSQPAVDLFDLKVTEPVAAPVLADVDDFVGPFNFVTPGEATNTISLVAYGLGGLRFQQGHPLPLRLHWLAPAEPAPDLDLRLQLWQRPRLALFGEQATPIATQTLSLTPGYPVHNWSPGRLVSLLVSLPISTDAPPGRADLTLAVLGPDSQPWMVHGEGRLKLGTLTVEERPMLKKLPGDLAQVQVDFGDQIGLRGYRVDGEARPGGQLEITYAWYAMRQPERIYAIFNHLLTADGQKITQVDGWPQGGVVLTTQWRPGEYVLDRYTLQIPADAPPGPYLLAAGLYDAANGERLSVVHEGQRLPNEQWLTTVDGRQ